MAGDMSKPTSQVCKVVMLGDSGCGKSCILDRFLHDKFTHANSPTIGAAFGTKTVMSVNGPVALHIWDTAGQERYQALANLYYRDANAAIICCDLTSAQTYNRVRYWLKQVQNQEKNCKIYVCGNKIDLIWNGEKRREVRAEDLEHFKVPALQTSSKENYNITQLFQMIADNLEVEVKTRGFELQTDLLNEQDSKNCCTSGQ